MKRDILIDSVCGRKRLAIIEEGKLCEIHYENSGHNGLSGNIYTGRVMNVLTGMNAAFVDIGLEKNAFLHAGDISPDLRDDRDFSARIDKETISSLVRPGQEIMVQVVKEPGGTKGPRISSHITLPGHLLVLLPTIKYASISRKIEEPAVRASLRELSQHLVDMMGMGLILRTAAAEAAEADIVAEYSELVKLWDTISNKARTRKAPALIYDGDTIERLAVRDFSDSDTTIITDDSDVFEKLKSEAAERSVNLRMHSGDIPLFDLYSVDSQYDKALRHNVWLKSGGYLVIDHTEALTVIDVNTGKYVGNRSHEETILRTNTEAAYEIARQLRLRDIGGIIVVDFIDMTDLYARAEILNILRTEMQKDRTPSTVVGMTQLGLVELTRKKRRLSADKIMRHICPNCGGEGRVASFESIAWKIVYALRRKGVVSSAQPYRVRLSSGVAGALIAIGAPKGMKVHLTPENIPDEEFIIEPLEYTSPEEGIKFLRTC